MDGKIELITGSNNIADLVPDFEKVIGQEFALKKLSFFIENHSSDNPIPTLLFMGSHGLGKTYVAEKIAKNMNRRFVEINCGVIETDKDFIEGVLLNRVLGDTPVTLFLDESHSLNSEITTILLSLLNPSSSMKNELRYKNWTILFDMSKINVIFATTDAHKMFGPLKNRCQEVYFESYDIDSLVNMLKLYCPNVKFNCDKNSLAEACRGRGRNAFVLAQNVNRYFSKKNTNVLGEIDWENLKSIFEIYPLGLNRQEVELLKIVYDQGPISSANIALTMMVNTDNVESEIEIRPRELGLVKSSSRGRMLSEKGIMYVESLINK
jgi:Holliday junction DNA helicase RuvB